MEDDFPFPGVYFQVPAVNLPGCTYQHLCFGAKSDCLKKNLRIHKVVKLFLNKNRHKT